MRHVSNLALTIKRWSLQVRALGSTGVFCAMGFLAPLEVQNFYQDLGSRVGKIWHPRSRILRTIFRHCDFDGPCNIASQWQFGSADASDVSVILAFIFLKPASLHRHLTITSRQLHVPDQHSRIVYCTGRSHQCPTYAWPSGEVFRDYKYLSAEIYLCAEIFSTCADFFFWSPKIYFLCGNIFNTPRFLFFAPRKYFHVLQKMLGIPGILFTSPKIICCALFFCITCADFLFPCTDFLFRAILGQAVMPWLVKWSEDGIFGTLDGILNTCSSGTAGFSAFKFLSTTYVDWSIHFEME